MSFLGMGPLEILIILLIAFVILGPEKMMDTARWMGKAVRELRRMASELPSLTEEDFKPQPINRRTDAKAEAPQASAPAADDTSTEDADDADGPVEFHRTSRSKKASAASEPAAEREQAP